MVEGEDMKERPILFKGEMVSAILNGRKTQTRRIMKPQPEPCIDERGGHRWPSRPHQSMLHVENEMQNGAGGWEGLAGDACPYGQPNDRFWIREAWRTYKSLDTCKPSMIAPGAGIQYEALGTNIDHEDYLLGMGKLRPSMFMPRWASRITLEITNIRIERVQEITGEEALREGCYGAISARNEFMELWDLINAKRGFGWDLNPWVWVIEFRRMA
jgi:hypothetical protein